MLATIARLHEISERCLSGNTLSVEQAVWLGEALSRFVSLQSATLEEALGIAPRRGGVSWRKALAIQRRNSALVEMAKRHFSGLSASAQGRAIRVLSVRYAASAWRFDRQRRTMPSSYAGTPQEWLWHAFSAGSPMPICERQIRSILSQLIWTDGRARGASTARAGLSKASPAVPAPSDASVPGGSFANDNFPPAANDNAPLRSPYEEGI
jgi:hypothetical protein